MPLRLELKASATGPGYAQLTVAGWNQDAGSIELSVQRNQDGRFLDESGEWTTNPVWHDVSILEKTADGLGGEMGPWLVDPLVKNPQVAYMFELRSPDHKDKGVLRIMGGILSSQAAGNSLNPEARTRPQNAAPVVKEEPPTPPPAPPKIEPPKVEPSQLEPTQVKTPEPEPSMSMKFGMQAINDGTVVQKKPDETSSTSGFPPHSQVTDAPVPPAPKKRSMLPLYLTLIGLLLLVSVGAAWYLGLFTTGKLSGAGGNAASSGACGEEAMKAGDDLAFVQGCLKSSPSSDQVLAVIAAAKEAKLCNIAQRLYAYKAQGGDAKIALAYAHEYDPDSFEAGGCIESADGETAAYWYEIVVNHDPNNAEAKQRLEKLGK